jgi:hypothetical protein
VVPFNVNSGSVKVKVPNLGIVTALPILNYFETYTPKEVQLFSTVSSDKTPPC